MMTAECGFATPQPKTVLSVEHILLNISYSTLFVVVVMRREGGGRV
jgi:hypothetical protein